MLQCSAVTDENNQLHLCCFCQTAVISLTHLFMNSVNIVNYRGFRNWIFKAASTKHSIYLIFIDINILQMPADQDQNTAFTSYDDGFIRCPSTSISPLLSSQQTKRWHQRDVDKGAVQDPVESAQNTVSGGFRGHLVSPTSGQQRDLRFFCILQQSTPPPPVSLHWDKTLLSLSLLAPLQAGERPALRFACNLA